MESYLLNTYNQLPVQFTKGEGVWLYDDQNNKYLDALAGIAVTGLGHNHPRITKVICQQASKLLHVSNLVNIPAQEALAKKLSILSNTGGKVFFNNSGAEAVETAIKLARLYGHSLNYQQPKIIVMSGAFHGRTFAALSASASPKVQAGFAPLLPGFIRAQYNDIAALEELQRNHQEIVAVLLEPIQGEGGIVVPAANYLAQLRQLCDQHNWLLLADEIQTGMGRTGKLFAYQHAEIIPDAVILAKGLANGLPIGACIVRDRYCDLFKPGSHGSTFGGNPLACSVALETLNIITENKLDHQAAASGDLLLSGLTESIKHLEHVKEVRGKGLMLGIELDTPCRKILQLALEQKIIFNVAQERTIRLLPPLITEPAQLQQIIKLIPQLIQEFFIRCSPT